MHKIALVNCFFGPFPWYFDFFLKSCDYNQTIDFIIFSDNSYTKNLPKNVKIIYSTLESFNLLASSKLQMTISIKKPYKLCDFKPAYGIIFSDYLKAYDFWGMCDIDIILGRIREFISTELLNEYQIISTRHDYLSGWFMLFKNVDNVNNLFRKSSDFKKVFSSDKHYCFDECNFKHLLLEDEKTNILDITCEIESMEHVIQKQIQLKNINVFYDLIMADGLCGSIKWDNGILSYKDEFEILLYHLIRYKSNRYTHKPMWKYIPTFFYIDKYGFRKLPSTSFSGICNKIYFNILKRNMNRMIHYILFYLSSIYNSKTNFPYQNTKFKNHVGDDCIWISENTISFISVDNSPQELFSSIFAKSVFYLKKHPALIFYWDKYEKGIPLEIYLIHPDGSIINYELETKYE